jgi:hypothetical protein
MDVVAHMLWAAAGTAFAARRFTLSRRTIVATLALAALPDVLQFIPLVAWSLSGQGQWSALWTHATALPGQEPVLPALVGFTSHHLHCIAHSAVIAGAVTVLVWCATRSLWFPLLGWWSHIAIDVFTHSAGFYVSPVLYPFTYGGFDGVAWNEPWFMALNYAALALVGLWWLGCCARSSRRPMGRRRISDQRPRSDR